MKSPHDRLPHDAPRGFGGSETDRSRPIKFRLDGRTISGFAGDTVLSAVLASGIDTLGRHKGQLIGLTSRSAPLISHVQLAKQPERALPMARTPAVDGAEFVTLGRGGSSGISRLFQPAGSLGLNLDQLHGLDSPWRSTQGDVETGHDLVVVGSGVAGLSAALAAARAGLRVALIEARSHLGGHSGLFGTQEGEDSPEASMARLSAEVMANEAISVLTSAHAYAIRPGRVRVHHVQTIDRLSQARVIDLEAPQIILATGALERLPIFSGNRLPGVIGALDAYEMATRHGVWHGRSAIVATVSNPVYRLAMLANDVGIAIPRILDGRSKAASRFIEFSRAYGIVQAPGTVPAAASLGSNGSLSIELDGAAAPLSADRLIVCGGWQPDLTLWHIAGGISRWNNARHRLEAEGLLDGIVLAGSALGYLTRRGCIASGAGAVDLLLGRQRQPTQDTLIDTLYETPDGAAPVAAHRDGMEAYLDAGPQLLARPHKVDAGLSRIFRRSDNGTGLKALSEAPQPLGICEVAAGVDLGLIPQAAAGTVAQERVALVPLALPKVSFIKADIPSAQQAEYVPSFLANRFGTDAITVRLKPDQERRFEPGALIYQSSDADQPLMAVGVILREHEGIAIALVSKQVARPGQQVSVRDHGRANPARILEATP